jgi:transposase
MAKARLRTAIRNQYEFVQASLDELVAEDHWVRTVWTHVSKLDLTRFIQRIKAVEGNVGRDATDPRILLALWVVALSEGVCSARQLADLTERDLVYRWICGGVTVNRNMLADFMSNRAAELDHVLTRNVAALMAAGVVKLDAVAQDGMKVRASAGASSFRREDALKECLEVAKAQLKKVREGLSQENAVTSAQRQAARRRAAEEQLAAVERAMAELPAVMASKQSQKNKTRAAKNPPRVSTTDPEARVMKMADGGFRPAWNPQFATDVDSGCIVGVLVTNKGTDVQELESCFLDVLARTGVTPLRYLADGGYASHDNIVGLASAGCEVLVPVRQVEGKDVHAPVPSDPPEVAAWRQHMATPEAKEAYKQRASTAERANAELRTMGLRQLTVRGLSKVTSAVLLSAVAFNVMRMLTLT